MSATVIPFKFYRTPAGRAFSRFTAWRPDDAVLVSEGFTIAWPDGTEGCARRPFATTGEAEAYLAKVPPGFRGMSQS